MTFVVAGRRRETGVAQLSPRLSFVIVLGAMTFNMALCFVNTKVGGVGNAAIIGCEVVIVSTVLLLSYPVIDYARFLVVSSVLLYLIALAAVRTAFHGEGIQIKPVRDLLIPIAFFFFGMRAADIRRADLLVGIAARHYFPEFIGKLNKPVKALALLMFLAFLVGAFVTNRAVFFEYLPAIFGVVFVQNALAFGIGYYFAKLFKLPEDQSRSISIETGIHNSGLGLILVMTFFKGNGGMAIIAAWWGIWHIVAGVALAQW